MYYYYIRILDANGSILACRCEKASTPREACRLAFGMIYDGLNDTCRYKNIGKRSPKYLTQEVLQQLKYDPIGWERIPES